jgi:hypothetical protein
MMSATVAFQMDGAGFWFRWLVKRWIASSGSATLVSVLQRRRRDFCRRDSRVSSGADMELLDLLRRVVLACYIFRSFLWLRCVLPV